MSNELPSDKILEKIRALLALSTSSNEFEAALAASKAQELLLRHNLDVSQIKGQKEEEVTRQDFAFAYRESWLDSLLNIVCTTNLCKAIQGTRWVNGHREGNVFIPGKQERVYYVFGKQTNIEVVEYLFGYLAGEVERLTPTKKPVRYKKAFKLGAVQTIGTRMRQELHSFQSTPDTKALVLVSDKAVAERAKEDFPHTRKTGRATIGDIGAYQDGKAAGESIQFRKGVNANAAGQALLV